MVLALLHPALVRAYCTIVAIAFMVTLTYLVTYLLRCDIRVQNVMMCGTRAHGYLADALRNGGCGFLFYWDNLRPADSYFYGLDGQQTRQVNGMDQLENNK